MLTEIPASPCGKAFGRAVRNTRRPTLNTYNIKREHVVAVPKVVSIRARKRDGRSHELAMRTLLHSPDDTPWVLVQGYVKDGDDTPQFLAHHSWLECGDMVYDAVIDTYYKVEEHRDAFCAIGVHEYTRLEMCQQIRGHYEILNYFGPKIIPSPGPAKRKQAA